MICIVGVVIVFTLVNLATLVFTTDEDRMSAQAYVGPTFRRGQFDKPKSQTSRRSIDPDASVDIMELQNRTVLRNLTELAVSVEGIDPEIEKEGLKRATLKADTELQLRGAGIKVLSKEELYQIKGATGLYLNVHVLKHDSAGYIHNVSLSLKEEARLIRVAYLAPLATTWESEVSLGVTPNMSDIKATVKDLVDEFIDMYLAANPK
jgi:hypothetical protein